MKRKAARDYEDLLQVRKQVKHTFCEVSLAGLTQCAIPAFESLLPEPHNSILMKLLYICAQWHALAKLRIHHDMTLQLLDYTTTWLGAQMRLFNHRTCSRTSTKELQREADSRAKREGKGKSKGKTARKPAKFSIFTIKFHFLGDYVSYIKRFGTTDSYNSETVSQYSV